MKKILLITTILANFSTLACPKLAGSYSCTQKDDMGVVQSFTMDIAQRGNVFKVSTDGAVAETLIADGITRVFETVGQELNMTLTCSSDALVMDMEGEVVIGDEKFDMSANTTLEKSGSILTQESVTKALGNTVYTTAKCKEI